MDYNGYSMGNHFFNEIKKRVLRFWDLKQILLNSKGQQPRDFKAENHFSKCCWSKRESSNVSRHPLPFLD